MLAIRDDAGSWVKCMQTCSALANVFTFVVCKQQHLPGMMYKFKTVCNMSEDRPSTAGNVYAAAGVTSWYLHEVGLQQAFTRCNMMTTHKTKIAGFCPAQCWSLNPKRIATLCKASPLCAEHAAAMGHEHGCMITVQSVRQLHDINIQKTPS